ncbi:hypothetical protein ACFUT3_30480 [Streptomyces cinereoruber]|uniref:hypothetical protein n=1 Tax=Streptomyces cinereoruber TaxID=67260 RepID=UPI003639410A
MTAFDASQNTKPMNFVDTEGRSVTLRPIHDAGLGRNVVELAVHGATVRLSNATVSKFVDGMTWAAFLGEIENVATGNHTPAGA